MKIVIAAIVTADVLIAAYCARIVYYALKGRHSPERAWAEARVKSRHLDRELRNFARDTKK